MWVHQSTRHRQIILESNVEIFFDRWSRDGTSWGYFNVLTRYLHRTDLHRRNLNVEGNHLTKERINIFQGKFNTCPRILYGQHSDGVSLSFED